MERIVSRPSTKEFRDHYDRIFKKRVQSGECLFRGVANSSCDREFKTEIHINTDTNFGG